MDGVTQTSTERRAINVQYGLFPPPAKSTTFECNYKENKCNLSNQYCIGYFLRQCTQRGNADHLVVVRAQIEFPTTVRLTFCNYSEGSKQLHIDTIVFIQDLPSTKQLRNYECPDLCRGHNHCKCVTTNAIGLTMRRLETCQPRFSPLIPKSYSFQHSKWLNEPEVTNFGFLGLQAGKLLH